MQLNRCPICHSRISLDALVQDEAGREKQKMGWRVLETKSKC